VSKKSNKKVNTTTVPSEEVPKNIVPIHVNFLDLKHLSVIALMVIIVLGVYIRSINYEYVLDDVMMIKDNQFTNEGFKGIGKHLTNESMTGYFGEQKNLLPGNRYRPLSLVTFSIEKGFTGELSPKLGHINNILLYIITGIIIFLLFRILFSQSQFFKDRQSLNFIFPALIAVLFVSHPLHVEAVANIKGRDEILSLLLSLVALYYYVKSSLSKQSKYIYYGAISYFLALLSKENAITWIVIIPFTLHVFLSEGYLKSLKSLGVTTALYLFWRSIVSGVPKLGEVSADIMNNPFLGMEFIEKFSTILFTLLKYIQLLFVPYPLTHDYYPYAIPKMNLGNWEVWLSILVYGFLVWLALKAFKQKSILTYGVMYYLITLSIVSNIVINLGTFMNDRFVYMPSLGFCIVLIWGLYKISSYIKGKYSIYSFYGMSALIILPYIYLSYARVPAWENSLTLNESAFPASENSARANSFMSTALYNEYRSSGGDNATKLKLLQEARPYAIKALQIIPDYHNANMMLGGIAGETYRLTNDLNVLLEDFYTIATNRPDIDFKKKADGSPSSFITEYLQYLNDTQQGNPQLRDFYIKLLNAMHLSSNQRQRDWKIYIADKALAGFPSDPGIVQLVTTIKGR
jgi:protein O-mannosyl-transferase